MASFYLKQKVLTARDQYKLFDEKNQLVYEAKAKAFSFGRIIVLKPAKSKQTLFTIKRKRWKLRPTFTVHDDSGKQVAKTIKRRAFMKQRVTVDTIHGGWQIEGNYWAHHFSLMDGNQTLAMMQKKRLSWGDTYAIDLTGSHDEAFYLALMVLIDSKFHSRKKRRRNKSRRRVR